MNILYDHQIFMLQRFGGISRYYFELLQAADKLYRPSVEVRYHINHYIEDIKKSESYPWNCEESFGGRSFTGKGIFCRFLERFTGGTDPWKENCLQIKKALHNEKIHVFHPTYYNDYYFNWIGEIPSVITVYDMIHELFPDNFMDDFSTVELKKRAIFKAKHIIAISENTKKDIVEIYGIPEEKISVIHLASNLNCYQSGKPPAPVAERYILYVGMRSGYKNFYFFLRAVADLLKTDESLHLVCTGNPFDKKEMWFIDSLGIRREQILQLFVSDDDLAYLYKNALLFAFPSLYEGFGLPVLEAFQYGCPTVLSRTGSLPEVGGDAALYYDPKSIGEIRETVKNVIYNEQLRNSYIQKGYSRLKAFSWDKTRKKTAEVYEKIL
ncbi:glycosyltransferase family 4 protein [Candidatus Electrothrix sp.]|uniref:glycosyltransferase family 4 protein n=1 Tax=Candidatus Electrothrix sp. TaxID=2170559 RepID=UPI00405754EF